MLWPGVVVFFFAWILGRESLEKDDFLRGTPSGGSTEAWSLANGDEAARR